MGKIEDLRRQRQKQIEQDQADQLAHNADLQRRQARVPIVRAEAEHRYTLFEDSRRFFSESGLEALIIELDSLGAFSRKVIEGSFGVYSYERFKRINLGDHTWDYKWRVENISAENVDNYSGRLYAIFPDTLEIVLIVSEERVLEKGLFGRFFGDSQIRHSDGTIERGIRFQDETRHVITKIGPTGTIVLVSARGQESVTQTQWRADSKAVERTLDSALGNPIVERRDPPSPGHYEPVGPGS